MPLFSNNPNPIQPNPTQPNNAKEPICHRFWPLISVVKVFEELYDYCCAVAGASLHAADRLCRGNADVAVNWGGGRYSTIG